MNPPLEHALNAHDLDLQSIISIIDQLGTHPGYIQSARLFTEHRNDLAYANVCILETHRQHYMCMQMHQMHVYARVCLCRLALCHYFVM